MNDQRCYYWYLNISCPSLIHDSGEINPTRLYQIDVRLSHHTTNPESNHHWNLQKITVLPTNRQLGIRQYEINDQVYQITVPSENISKDDSPSLNIHFLKKTQPHQKQKLFKTSLNEIRSNMGQINQKLNNNKFTISQSYSQQLSIIDTIQIEIVKSQNKLDAVSAHMLFQQESLLLNLDQSKVQHFSTHQTSFSLASTREKFKTTRHSKQKSPRFERTHSIIKWRRKSRDPDHSTTEVEKIIQQAQNTKQLQSKNRKIQWKRSFLEASKYHNSINDEIDESQTLEQMKKKGGNMLYILVILLQIVILLSLMSPSSKV